MQMAAHRNTKRARTKYKGTLARLAGAALLCAAFNTAAQPGNEAWDSADGLSPYQRELQDYVARNEAAFANVRFFFVDQQRYSSLKHDADNPALVRRHSDPAELESAYRENAAGYGVDLSSPAVRASLIDSYSGLENPENPFPEHVEFMQHAATAGNGITVFVATPDHDSYAGHCFIVGQDPYETDRTAILGHAMLLDDNISLPPSIQRATLDRFIANEELGHCGHLGRLHDPDSAGPADVRTLRGKADPDDMGIRRYRMLGEGTAMAFSLMKTMRETGDAETLRFIRNAVAMFPMLDFTNRMYYDIHPVISAAWDFASDPANSEPLNCMSAEELLDKAERFATDAYKARSDAEVEKQHAMLAALRKGQSLTRKTLSDIADVLEHTEFPDGIAPYKTAFLSGWADMQAQGVTIRQQPVAFAKGLSDYRAELQKVFARLAKPQDSGQATSDKDKRLVYLAEYQYRANQVRWGESAALHKTLSNISSGGAEIPPAMKSYFSGLEHGDWFNAADKRDIAEAGAFDFDYEPPVFEPGLNFDTVFENVAHAAMNGDAAGLSGYLDRAARAAAQGQLGTGEVQSLLDEALTQSATGGHTDIVIAMIGRGANPAAFDALGLQWAAANGHAAVVDVLLQHAGRLPVSGLREAYDWAQSEGHDAIADRIGAALRDKICRTASCKPTV